MSTKGIADVVFCIDASASMQPCINSVRTNLASFVDGLKTDQQVEWDLRLDFVAHCASASTSGAVYRHRSLHNDECWEALYKTSQGGRFFTNDRNEFRNGLARIAVQGDEAALVGLDFALDFPWREAVGCHRVIIMLTDEPLEQGVEVDTQKKLLSSLIEKIQTLHVMLFLIAPESPGFEKLSETDKSEWEVVANLGDGLAGVDFRKVLGYIGKSVSKSNVQQSLPKPVKRGLFGQAGWGTINAEFRGT